MSPHPANHHRTHPPTPQVGELKTVSIHYDSNNKPKGAAEIVYRHRAGAEAAVKEFDGREVRSGRGAGGGRPCCRGVAC